MRYLQPANTAPVTDDELAELYDYPAQLNRPWVQANFVSSVDGAVSVSGVSHGLSHAADKRIMQLGRELADVILVGAGTVRAENYRGVKMNAGAHERRRHRNLAASPPIAVVSASAAIAPDSRLLVDTDVPPIIFTTESAPLRQRADLVRAGADVVVLGEHTVEPTELLAELARRELFRVNCEGGPQLFGEFVSLNLIDQLCLTISPLLAGPGVGRISQSLGDRSLPLHAPPLDTRPLHVPAHMELASVLTEDDFLMLRYRKKEAAESSSDG